VKSGTGSANGTSRRAAFDRWFRYPAGFSSPTLDRCFAATDVREGTIVDPFAGVGTTGTASITRGFAFRGIETHPFVAEIASLKFSAFPGDATRLVDEAAAVGERASATLSTTNITLETELVTRSFSATTLRALVSLRAAIGDAPAEVQPYLRLALAATLRDVADVKVGWPHQRPALKRKAPHQNATKRFAERVKWIADDLKTVSARADASITIGDSRKAAAWEAAVGATRAEVCLSSPPYLNNFDYADATRLEVYFFGLARSWADLCSVVRVDMVAASTQQSTRGRADAAWAALNKYEKTRERAETLAASLTHERKARGRGKEYDQMLPAYLADIAAVLTQAHAYLSDRGYVVWVVGDSAPYGVYLDTPALISDLAREVGFEPVADTHLRSRGKRWAVNGTRHQVALSERLVALRRVAD
jgi:hypothetical protein